MSKFKDKRALINKLSEERMSICRQCPSFTKFKVCKECGCVMPLKVKLEKAKCPIGRW